MLDASQSFPSQIPQTDVPAAPRSAEHAASQSAYEVFSQAVAGRIDYFRHWTHDVPMVVSGMRDSELNRIQRVLAACAHHYAECYEDYLSVIGHDEAVLEALELVRGLPYELGTFRPDYLIGEDGSIRVCEITSRFFGNGYFYSFFMDHTGRQLAQEAGVDTYTSRIEEMLELFADMARGKDELIVLKSADRSDSIPLYTPFYERLGLKVNVINAESVEASFRPRPTSLVVSALNQVDLLRLSRDALARYVDAGTRNDLRTVLLLHDKRLFALFHDDGFCEGCLNADDTAFLRNHVVRTYLFPRDRKRWEEARRNKDAFIVKPCRLGKSEQVKAGCLCAAEEWESLFDAPERSLCDMVLQPFIRQRPYPALWKGDPITVYICGTILCIDDRYFGTGNYRASSLPVVNIGDDTKVAPLVTDAAPARADWLVL